MPTNIKSSPKSFGKSASPPLTAENAVASCAHCRRVHSAVDALHPHHTHTNTHIHAHTTERRSLPDQCVLGVNSDGQNILAIRMHSQNAPDTDPTQPNPLPGELLDPWPNRPTAGPNLHTTIITIVIIKMHLYYMSFKVNENNLWAQNIYLTQIQKMQWCAKL